MTTQPHHESNAASMNEQPGDEITAQTQDGSTATQVDNPTCSHKLEILRAYPLLDKEAQIHNKEITAHHSTPQHTTAHRSTPQHTTAQQSIDQPINEEQPLSDSRKTATICYQKLVYCTLTALFRVRKTTRKRPKIIGNILLSLFTLCSASLSA
jgi:hypothetical protein